MASVTDHAPAASSFDAARLRERAADACASAHALSRIVSKLMLAGVDRAHVVDAHAALGRELAHADLYDRAAETAAGHALEPNRARLDATSSVELFECATDALEASVRDLIAFVCCSETVAVALVAAARDQASTPALRATLARVTSGKVANARFGWHTLDALCPALDTPAKRRVSVGLVATFERELSRHTPRPDDHRRALHTLATVVAPGLERHGLAADLALKRASRMLAREAA